MAFRKKKKKKKERARGGWEEFIVHWLHHLPLILSAWRNRTWKCVTLPRQCVFLCVREQEGGCDVRLHMRRYIKKEPLSTPPRCALRMCAYTYICDLHTNLCLVTHLPVCLIFPPECQPVSVCWPVLRGSKDVTSGPSGFYYKILFCSGGRPEAVKSSIIIGSLSPFIHPALNLRALCGYSGCTLVENGIAIS